MSKHVIYVLFPYFRITDNMYLNQLTIFLWVILYSSFACYLCISRWGHVLQIYFIAGSWGWGMGCLLLVVWPVYFHCVLFSSSTIADIWYIGTLRPRQNGHRFPEDIFKCIFLNENVWISLKISLKFVSKGPINNIQALFQIMAWCLVGSIWTNDG